MGERFSRVRNLRIEWTICITVGENGSYLERLDASREIQNIMDEIGYGDEMVKAGVI